MQFRLKSLFAVVSFVAVACGVLVALPDWLSCAVLGVAALISPAAIITAIVYGRGAVRAFAVGCLASGGWVLWVSPYVIIQGADDGFDGLLNIDQDTATAVKIVFVVFYGALVLSGLVGVGIRRLSYQGHNRIRPPRDC